MTNLFKSVMSFGNLREAAAPTNLRDQDTLVDMQDIGAKNMEPIPNFAEAGITDHMTILEELSWGPAAGVFVGKETRPFMIPKRILIYHSLIAAQRLTKVSGQTRSDTLELPDSDPHAFFRISRWMQEDKLGILEHYTRTDNSTGIQEACTLLCRMFVIAYDLEIATIQPLILQELGAAFAMARDAGKRTPIAPSTLMEVWEEFSEGHVLWKLLLQEMCDAFSGTPMPVYAEYDECFKVIDPLRLAVVSLMTDRLLFKSEQ